MKQRAKAPATKSKSGGNSRQLNLAPTNPKKPTNNRKRPALERNGDTSSDEEPEIQHPRKKTKHGSHKANEEVEEDITDESPEEVEDEDDGAAEEVEKVSY